MPAAPTLNGRRSDGRPAPCWRAGPTPGDPARVVGRHASRKQLPADVDWMSTSERCVQISRLNGTARSTREAEVAPDSASRRIDLAKANLCEATFAPRKTTLRKSVDELVIDAIRLTVLKFTTMTYDRITRTYEFPHPVCLIGVIP